MKKDRNVGILGNADSLGAENSPTALEDRDAMTLTSTENTHDDQKPFAGVQQIHRAIVRQLGSAKRYAPLLTTLAVLGQIRQGSSQAIYGKDNLGAWLMLEYPNGVTDVPWLIKNGLCHYAEMTASAPLNISFTELYQWSTWLTNNLMLKFSIETGESITSANINCTLEGMKFIESAHYPGELMTGVSIIFGGIAGGLLLSGLIAYCCYKFNGCSKVSDCFSEVGDSCRGARNRFRQFSVNRRAEHQPIVGNAFEGRPELNSEENDLGVQSGTGYQGPL